MITGPIGRTPRGHGGHAWALLQYVLGFRRLGVEAFYVEHGDPERFVDEEGRPFPLASSINARYFRALIERFDLEGCASLLESDGCTSLL